MRIPLAAIIVAAAALSTPARADSEQSGVWTYTYEPSSTGKGGIVTALSPSPGADLNDPSYLVARCMGGRTEFLIGGAGGWGTPRRTLDVTVSVDGGLPQTSPWDVSTNGKAVFLDSGVEEFLKKVPDDGKLTVSIKDAVGEKRENIFSTKGFDVVRAKIAEACGWPR